MSDQDLQPPRPPSMSPLNDEDRWAVLLLISRNFPDLSPIELMAKVLAAETAWMNSGEAEKQVYGGNRLYWRAILASTIISLEKDREFEAMTSSHWPQQSQTYADASERPTVRRSDPALPPLAVRVRSVLEGLHDQAFDAALVVDDELADVLRAWLNHQDMHPAKKRIESAPDFNPGIRIENVEDSNDERSFDAYLCDTANGMEIWSGNGHDPLWAVMDLAEQIAIECANRAQFLPEGYVDVQDR